MWSKLNLNQELKLSGFRIYRKDRNGRGGGVAIAVKANLIHEVINSTPSIEAVGVLSILWQRAIPLISCYKPPPRKISPSDLFDLFSSHQRIVILGDLNTKHAAWNCSSQ